jgi:hypothetical protein
MPEAQTLGLPRAPRPFFDVHRGVNKCTPMFRVYQEGNIRHAVCEECERHGAHNDFHYVDRVEWGWSLLRLNMHEHASVHHTHR